MSSPALVPGGVLGLAQSASLPDKYAGIRQAHAYLRAAEDAVKEGKLPIAAHWIACSLDEAKAALMAIGKVRELTEHDFHKLGHGSSRGDAMEDE